MNLWYHKWKLKYFCWNKISVNVIKFFSFSPAPPLPFLNHYRQHLREMVNGQEKPSESMLNRETLQNMKLPLLPNLPSSLSTETTHRHLLSPPARNSRKRPHRQGNKSCAASSEQWPHHGVLLGNHMQSMTFIRLENQWRKQYDGHISQFSFEPYRTWDAAEAGQGIRAKGLLPHIPAGLDWKPASFYLLTAKESSQILGWKAFCFRGECELKCVCGCRKAKKKQQDAG